MTIARRCLLIGRSHGLELAFLLLLATGPALAGTSDDFVHAYAAQSASPRPLEITIEIGRKKEPQPFGLTVEIERKKEPQPFGLTVEIERKKEPQPFGLTVEIGRKKPSEPFELTVEIGRKKPPEPFGLTVEIGRKKPPEPFGLTVAIEQKKLPEPFGLTIDVERRTIPEPFDLIVAVERQRLPDPFELAIEVTRERKPSGDPAGTWTCPKRGIMMLATDGENGVSGTFGPFSNGTGDWRSPNTGSISGSVEQSSWVLIFRSSNQFVTRKTIDQLAPGKSLSGRWVAYENAAALKDNRPIMDGTWHCNM